MFIKIMALSRANNGEPQNRYDEYREAESITVRAENRKEVEGGFVWAVDMGPPLKSTRFVDPNFERIFLMNDNGRTIDSY